MFPPCGSPSCRIVWARLPQSSASNDSSSMSQNGDRNLEGGEDAGIQENRSHDENQPSQGEFNLRDGSGPLFSMYSTAADEVDKEMVERWKQEADGIILFTGLFSAAVAALLSVSVQSLIPNSQDTSSFYLGNIYGILADPNATRASTPPPVAQPPPFSPPTSAIWVNSLWFLSFVISLTCALLATSLQQWARRYIRVTQPARSSPEKRARMRAYFASGVEKMRTAWVVEGLPTLLHLSVFLFFGGLVIFLFNINDVVFNSVVWWIGLFIIVYGLITVMPIFRHDSPYYSPLSTLAWFLYATISYLFFKVLFTIKSNRIHVFKKWQRLRTLKDRSRDWILGGVEKAAEETVSEQLSKIDIDIFGWTIDALGNDDMEEFLEAIPGFFNSKKEEDLKELPDNLLEMFWKVSDGFIDRTLLSSSVTEPVKSRQLDIGMNAMSVINNLRILPIPPDILFQSWDQAPQNVEMGYTLARWCTSDNNGIAPYAQCITTRILASVGKHDDRWIGLATGVLGLTEPNLRDIIAQGSDSVSLAILTSVIRRDLCSDFYDWGILSRLSKLDIHNTLSGQQHDFCALWNEIVREAREKGFDSYPVGILRLTRLLYIGLHQDTSAAPTSFSNSTRDFDLILFRPESYPYCDISAHRPDSTIPDSRIVPFPTQLGDVHSAPPLQPSSGDSAAPRLAEGTSIITQTALFPDQTKTGESGDTSQPPVATLLALPVRAILSSADGAPSSGVAFAPRDVTPTVTLFHPLESNKQQDKVSPLAAPDIGRIPFTAPTSSLVPVSAAPVVLASYISPASTPEFLLPTSSIISTSSPSPIPPLHNASLPDNPSDTSLPSPPENATLPRLRARGLINKGNTCFINAVLQLLVYCPPFWNRSKNQGWLKGSQIGGGKTVLIDATVRFLDEFAYNGKPPLRQQSLQLAEKGREREDEEKKEGDDTNPLMPTYMYDAMKEKRQLKNMLDGQQHAARDFFDAYLDVLEEELLASLTSTSTHGPASTAFYVEELKDGSKSGEARSEAGRVELPISRIFGGKLRTTMRVVGQPEIVTIEDWRRSLQLDIQHDSIHTIQDALAYMSQPQSVLVSPSGGSGQSKATQQATVLIEVLPPVLVLHLKRFVYNAATDDVVKIGKPIQFSPELEIPLDVMTPTAGQPSFPARYTLYGVLYHEGTSASGGHYTINVLHPNAHNGGGEAWLHVDDETVRTVRHEDVFGRHGDERTDGRCAYMLFYRHATSTQT